ncbi:MAG: UDP-3-O-(3-hydroxymyristoyl)glucosamine N-acyltransferase [Ignavibacteriae bacterium]|nr:UDP-3-O-(3-hydroxymyristoyl)glucosamine N-acyltransferase [Ignavibacteriota bacterium]
MKLSEIARLLNGEIVGNGDVEIERVEKIEDAGPGDITFLSNQKYRKHLKTTAASAVLISNDTLLEDLKELPSPLHFVKVSDPYLSFQQLLDHFHPQVMPLEKGIHPTAVIAKTAVLGEGVAIGAHVVICEHCQIGAHVSIYPATVIADGVEIGEGSILYSNITVREQCKIGKRAIIHAGTVIGSDGFGFAPKDDGTYQKIPQRGNVIIEGDVEIGANCTIDRATIGSTIIRKGVKLDNLIHVAHNVIIGENTVIAAQTGISGSTKIGKNCVIAGQVGFVGHIEIADRSTFGAQSGISKSFTEPGKTYFGYPAKEHHQALRIEGALRQLPELLVEIRSMKKRLEEVEQLLKLQTSDMK